MWAKDMLPFAESWCVTESRSKPLQGADQFAHGFIPEMQGTAAICWRAGMLHHVDGKPQVRFRNAQRMHGRAVVVGRVGRADRRLQQFGD